MLKKRIVNLVIAAVLLATMASGTGIVADELGFVVTEQVHACGGSGGSC